MTDRASSSTLSLPRASSLEPLRVSGRASPPAILRWYDTTPREMENEKGEEEREREKDRNGRRKRARERVEAECISPHYTDYVPLANISRCIDAHTLAKIRQKERLSTHAYRDVISDFFTIGEKKIMEYGQRRFSRGIHYRLHEDILIEMQTCEISNRREMQKVRLYLCFILDYIKEYSN